MDGAAEQNRSYYSRVRCLLSSITYIVIFFYSFMACESSRNKRPQPGNGGGPPSKMIRGLQDHVRRAPEVSARGRHKRGRGAWHLFR